MNCIKYKCYFTEVFTSDLHYRCESYIMRVRNLVFVENRVRLCMFDDYIYNIDMAINAIMRFDHIILLENDGLSTSSEITSKVYLNKNQFSIKNECILK